MVANRSNKDYSVAIMLSGIFGMLGFHQFYVERWVSGFFNLFLFAVALFLFSTGKSNLALPLILVDVFHVVIVTYLIFIGKYRDGRQRRIMFPGQQQ